MLSIKYKIITVLLLISISTKAQEQGVLSLQDILSIVENNNPMLKYYDSQIKSEDAKVGGAKSWIAPMVGAGTFMTPYPGKEIMDSRDKGALMFVIEQSIPSTSKNKAKEKYLASLSNTLKANKSLELNELRALVKLNYYDVIINKRKTKHLYENLHIMTNLKKLGEIRYQFNKGNLSQIYKAEGRIYETHNMLVTADNNIKIAFMNLNILMNRDADEELHIDTNISLSNNLLSYNNLLQKKSEIKIIEEEINTLKLNGEMIKTEAKPEFKLQFSHMAPLSSMMPQQYSLMGMMSIPIAPWSSKSYKSSLKVNQLEVEALDLKKEATIAQIYGKVKISEQQIKSMQHHIEMYEQKIIPAMKKNLDVLMLNYQENKEELPEVIDGWETLNKAQQDYLNELGDFYQMIIDYEKNIEK
jgi:cobalt-zinc-cadmium efflux system outer membrane protein